MASTENDKDLLSDQHTLMCVIKNLIQRCKTEAEVKELFIPINDYETRVSYYTGLSITYIKKLLLSEHKISTLHLDSRILILNTIKNMYIQDQLLNYPDIFMQANATTQITTVNGEIITDIKAFAEEMEILGYEWKCTTNNSTIIMEDPDIRFERYIYLNRLKKYKNSMHWKQIVYVDERIINEAQQYKKLSNVNNYNPSKTQESVIFHAVSKFGFISGMFTNQVSESHFFKWVTDILLGHLKTPSVIIMDNNPIHGTPEKLCTITKYHSKADMLRWLIDNNIPCSSNMSKPTLYELINKCDKDIKEYKIDNIIRSQGHEVLRLPRHLYDLSITTPLWQKIVENGGVSSASEMELHCSLMNLLTSIHDSQWSEYERYVEEKEKEIFNIDMALESVSDKYTVDFKKTS